MYVFSVPGPNGGWLPSLVELVSTREGRLAMREALTQGSSPHAAAPDGRSERDQLNRAG